jgi:hypothetical protein
MLLSVFIIYQTVLYHYQNSYWNKKWEDQIRLDKEIVTILGKMYLQTERNSQNLSYSDLETIGRWWSILGKMESEKNK